MGEYDCYCAFCSGCLYVPGAYGSDVFGSEAREALERRRERLREKIQARKGGPAPASSSDDSWEEDHTYDPTIVDHDCLKWLGSARALGMNMEARAASKAFISGRGTYSSYGDFNPEHGSDPNDDGTNPLPCFVSYDEDVPPAYPFHEACYRLFCHALFGHEDMNQIDKDVMYSTMRSLSGDRDTSCLSLDYGGMEGPEHTWYCISGEEYTVFKPSTNPKLIDVLRDLLPNQGFSGPSIDRLSIDSELETKVRNDIFSMLPLDILYMLFPYLSSETSINLMNASWHVFKATRRNGFWKQMIRNHILPWFWEFDTFIQTEDLDHIECRGLYVWLEGITRPQFGIRGPWMGLANRRRILNACEQVKKVYLKLKEGNYGVQGSHCGNGTDDDEAEEIKDDSVSLHLPAILEPKPAAELTTSVQWIRAWDEVESPGKIFESFWNGDGVLAGLGVVINSHRRVLGPTDEVPGIRKFSIDVPDAEWIEEILLHLTDPDILSEDESARTSAVKGLTITLTSGRDIPVLIPNPSVTHNIRPLQTPTFPAGARPTITGLVAYTNIISKDSNSPPLLSRLGLLLATPPDSAWASSTLAFKPQERLLWAPAAFAAAPVAVDPDADASRSDDNQLCPIWNHPRLELAPSTLDLPPDRSRHDSRFAAHFLPYDVLPAQVLLWARTRGELACLTRIEALVVNIQDQEELAKIVGLRVQFTEESGLGVRVVGARRVPLSIPVTGAEDTGVCEWPKENTVALDVDGPGGERVVDLFMAHEAGSNALILITNRGKYLVFGTKGLKRWTRFSDGWEVSIAEKPWVGGVYYEIDDGTGTPRLLAEVDPDAEADPDQRVAGLRDGEFFAGLAICFGDVFQTWRAEGVSMKVAGVTWARGVVSRVGGEEEQGDGEEDGENGDGDGGETGEESDDADMYASWDEED